MVRTSRNGAPTTASVDALDNLNLDDMFADEGDALFDGLDIDLGNMDDLAATATGEPDGDGDGDKKSDDGDRSMTSAQHSEAPVPAPVAPPPEEETVKRRKTKRKIKSPMFFTDDEDYEEPAKKRKRRSTKATATKAAGSKGAKAAKAAPPPTVTTTSSSKKKGSKKSESAKNAAASVAKASSTPAPIPPAKESPKPKAAVSTTTPKIKGKKGNAVATAAASVPPPVVRSTSGVAAAGQFGGRTKRGGASFSLPLSKSKNKATMVGKASSTTSATSAATPTLATAQRPKDVPPVPQRSSSTASSAKAMPQAPPIVKAEPPSKPTLAQIQKTHPGLTQGPFCGLLPSNTLFYPFMPSLPSEANFKNRKIVGQLDRLHQALMSHISTQTSASASAAAAGAAPAQESEPIFQLLKESFKDEKSNVGGADGGSVVSSASNADSRNKSVGEAIGALRKMINQIEKNQLAADLLAVCALLKRQYDFLKQNVTNMEQWCKNHFSESDYNSVYVPPKLKKKAPESTIPAPPPTPSVLSTLKRPEVKVKIFLSSGFKEPNKSGPLVAKLPPPFGVSASESIAPKPKSKKRKLPSTPSSAASAVASVVGAAAATVVPPAKPAAPTTTTPKVLPYAQLRPAKRRKNVADLIARVARDLESKYLQQLDNHRQAVDRQQAEIQKLISSDRAQVIHSTGMWKWLEKSGYFSPISTSEIRWRLDGFVSPAAGSGISLGPSCVVKDTIKCQLGTEGKTSLTVTEKLQSLLMVEGDDTSGESDEDSESFDDLYDDEDSSALSIDMKKLTGDERLILQLRAAGLTDKVDFPTAEPSESDNDDEASATVSSSAPEKEHLISDELGDVIGAMIADLGEINKFNSERITLLESEAQLCRLHEGDQSKKNEEAVAIAKYQQLLKKYKETKGKNGKAKVANNEFALPW